jgi:arylsulfatase A-like enzyme
LEFVRTSLVAGESFFALFAPFGPHDDPSNGFFAQPAPRHLLTFASVPPARPPNFMEEDVSDKPAGVQALPIPDAFHIALLDQHRRRHLEALLAVDEALAAVLAVLDEFGRRRDTLVVFTSDNGFAFGEHRRYSKPCPYDECHRVPLVLYYPRRIRRPNVSGAVALNVDVAPTILHYARVHPDRPLDGRSLCRFTRSTSVIPRPVPLEVWNLDDTINYRGVRTARWKYVEHPATDETELYDLDADPYELDNVAGTTPVAVAALRKLTRDLHAGE